MKKELPKLRKNSGESPAIARPKQTNKDNQDEHLIETPEEKQPFSPKIEDLNLNSSPWYKLAKFFDNTYQEFIPKDERQKEQKNVASIHKRCVAIIKEQPNQNWDEIIEKNFSYKNQQEAKDFFYYISTKPGQKRSEAASPAQVCQQLNQKLKEFVNLAEYAFIDTDNRDLIKLNLIADIIQSYQRSERTFLFLSELPSALDEQSRSILESSKGYQKILEWGASILLKKFWHHLQQEYRLTVDAITDEAAQNLARELGETETNLKNQLELLEAENNELKNTLAKIHDQSLQEAVCKLAKTLQGQPQPVLDQIFTLYNRLNKMSEEEQELSLTSSECLSVLITLESLITAFQTLNIIPFPDNTQTAFELEGKELDEYSYIEGSVFADKEDKKLVICIKPGWRVGEQIITPARVKETNN